MEYAIYPFKRKRKYRLYIRFFDESGRRRHLSTGITYPLKSTKKQRFEALREAEEVASEKIENYQTREVRKVPDVSRLSIYLKGYYYPHIRSSRAESTFISYRNALNHFIRICGDRPMKAYIRFDMHEYRLERHDSEGIRKTTINIEMRAIKSGFYWAYKNDMIDRMPFKGQDYLFDAKPNRRAFQSFEINKLFRATEGKMIGLVVRLAYYTGMRIGELSDMSWRMVNLEERFIHLPAEITKSNATRLVPLGTKAFNIVKILENQLQAKMRKHPVWYRDREFSECHVLQKERGWGKYERRSIQDMFRKAMNEAGLPMELKFHCLRHSFATHVLEKGADIYGVSKIMGHSTPNVTSQFYDHTTALHYRKVADLI